MPERLIESHIFRKAEALRARPYFGYVFAVGSFVVALMARFAVNDMMPAGIPFLTFFPAIIITGLIGGIRAGALCAVLSTLAAAYFFMPPFHSFMLTGPGYVALTFFIGVCVVDLLIIHIMNKSTEQLRKEKEHSEILGEQQKTLFQELQHRVANNLGFVSGLLAIHQGRVADKPEAVAALEDARLRIDMMSRVHRRLYDPMNVGLPVKEYLHALCADIIEATAVRNVSCIVEAPPVQFELEKLLTLSLVISEGVTNAIKHAFADGKGGIIRINLIPEGGNKFTLTIRDTGPGFPDHFDPSGGQRLGVRILQGFARSLNGDLSFANENGGIIRLAFKG